METTENNIAQSAKEIQDKYEIAENFKNQANEYFKNKDYDNAIDFYSKAIEAYPDSSVYYGNRSFAYLKLEWFGYALQDATRAIELDKNYIKGYYRRASAHMSLGKFKEALKDFELVTKIRPNDKDAKLKFIECSKIVRKLAFEKAISVEDRAKNIAESIDLEAMTIEKDYNGPQLEDGKVTLDFMIELMDLYKKQGKLHRKHAYKPMKNYQLIYVCDTTLNFDSDTINFLEHDCEMLKSVAKELILFPKQILLDVKTFFMAQPSLVDVTIQSKQKFTVCGDIHGQFYDLMNIFKLNGLPSEDNPYLFNGDFVDRGSFSVECIFTLFGFKLLYPNHFFMSRGNHESSTMNEMYGFHGEVKAKYSSQMCELFNEVYNWLPLAHLLSKKVLVMHGGLFSTDGVTLDDIRSIDRNRQPPDEGLMCDLLWSDPQNRNGRAPSRRGVGCQFGPDVTEAFVKENDLLYIIRSHEVKSQGYEVAHNNRCITVFSAPNYCDTMENLGAYINLDGDDLTPVFKIYEAVPHPKVRAMAYANSFYCI